MNRFLKSLKSKKMNSLADKNNGNSGTPQHKTITIFINGTPYPVPKDEMSFQELVILAQLPVGPNVSYTLMYRRGHGNKPEGILVEGESVKLKDQMVFDVTATNQS